MLAAVLFGGGLGYAMQLLAARLLTAEEYGQFGVLWSAVFFAAGAMAGVQQEVARATTYGAERGTRLVHVTLGVAVVTAAPVGLAALLAPDAARPGIVGVCIALAGIAALGVVTGALYGGHHWSLTALSIVIEACVRLGLIVAALVLGWGPWGIAAAIAVPFLITALLMAALARRRLEELTLAVRGRRLTSNLVQTVVASAASAALVSGFPALVKILTDSNPAALGAFIFAFTLTRAPLVVLLLSMQSFLIKIFQASEWSIRRLAGALLTVAVATLMLAGAASWIGPWLLANLFGRDYVLDASLLFWIVASAAPMCAICITGPYALARDRHATFTSGWVAATAVTAGVLLIARAALPDVEVSWQAVLAVGVGPLAGMAVHVIGARRMSSQDPEGAR